jgi:hypothetical protein
VVVTDGRFLAPEVTNFVKILYDVDGHGPDLWQEVGGLDVRNLFKFNTDVQGTSLIVESDESDENKTNLKIFFLLTLIQAWLSNISLNSLKSICRLTVSLIDEQT